MKLLLINFLSFLFIREVYSSCILFKNTVFTFRGTDCGKRCNEMNKQIFCEHSRYSIGCFCKPGYFRNYAWDCVRGDTCGASRGPKSLVITTTSKSPLVKVKYPPIKPTTMKPPKQCRPNELYDTCGSFCIDSCTNLAHPNTCPMNRCEQGCFCVDGYFRGDEGYCIPQEKCAVPTKTTTTTPAPILCPSGEKFSDCGKRCSEQCKNLTPKSKCPKTQCDRGCFCKGGLFRNDFGICVPQKDCSKPDSTTPKPKCKKNESFDKCGDHCVELCKPPDTCPLQCKSGCFCDRNFYRDDNGNCVPESECLSIPDPSTPKPDKPLECEAHEEYKECGSRCGQSCDIADQQYLCPNRNICISGCFCVEGYYKKTSGKCVKPDDCAKSDVTTPPPQCNENEENSSCGDHCSELCKPPNACPMSCENGCFCKKNFYRDHKGNCVPESECPLSSGQPTTPKPKKPLKCFANEKYSECGTRCGQLCSDVAKKLVCPKRRFCISGCFCLEGYYRDANGDCVKFKDCGIDEFTTIIQPSDTTPPETTTVSTTTLVTCNVNEEFYTCGDHCIEMCRPPETCATKCDAGCFCSKGFYRNHKGNCIPEQECPDMPSQSTTPKPTIPIKCEKNEEYSVCGTRCGQSCADQANRKTCPMRKRCVSGCFCLQGFYRDNNGDCVPIRQCIPPIEELTTTTAAVTTTIPQCAENQHFDTCGDHCIELCTPPDACEQACDSGCFCNRGFYRLEALGPCIPEKDCPQNLEPSTTPKPLQCEDNEEYSECSTRCGQMCADLGKQIICPKKGLCVSGCFCLPGFYRNDEGIGHCVPYVDCPDNRPPTEKPPICDQNEEYLKCGNRCGQTCEEVDKKKKCLKGECTAGCFCIEGYFKDEYGNCVPLIDCPDNTPTTPKPIICEANEEYKDCGSRCGQTCIESTKVEICPKKRSCVSGCFCQEGFVRNQEGECVPKKDCPKPKDLKKSIKCDANEDYLKCGTRCAQGCDDIGRKILCPKNRQCASGCFCKEGYYRDENGDCIPESDCPDLGPPNIPLLPPDCGHNEEYSDCGTRCGQGCDELGRRVICPRRRMCISGCFCIEGFFRNEEGVCVPLLDCPDISPPRPPPPMCDPNQHYTDCGHRCGQSCADQIRGKVCPDRQPCVTGCFCIPDYMRNQNGDCIPKLKCPPLKPLSKPIKCDPNEEYLDCGSRCGQGCEDLGNPVICPRRRMCVSGCFCVDGFYRSEVGECVPESECPPTAPPNKLIKCGAKNEKYSDCGTQCGQSCEEAGRIVFCPRRRLCVSGCFCKKGYYRDSDGSCVPRKQCPTHSPKEPKIKPPTKPDKPIPPAEPEQELIQKPTEPDKPIPPVEPEQELIQKPTEPDKPIPPVEPEQELIKQPTKPDRPIIPEELQEQEPESEPEPKTTEPTTKRQERTTTTTTTTTPTPRCPRTTEHEKSKGSRCKESCKYVTGPKKDRKCPKDEKKEKGCFCNQQLYRDKYGQCVPKDQCDCDLPPEKCPSPNEEYTACGYGCGVTCANLNNGIVRCPQTCGRGCFCTEGNLRNKNGKCVPKQECFTNAKPGGDPDSQNGDPMEQDIEPSLLGKSIFFQCGFGERFTKCGRHCGQNCQDLIEPPECPEECEVGCFCKKGLYRDSEGNCGPRSKCDLPTTSAAPRTPPKCPNNEAYSDCGNTCAESCEHILQCVIGCEKGCFCTPGNLRNKNSKCVPEDECKEKEQCRACKPNEFYTNCGSDCGNNCNHLDQNVMCPESCNKGCFCKLGFFRSSSGDCVPRSQC